MIFCVPSLLEQHILTPSVSVFLHHYCAHSFPRSQVYTEINLICFKFVVLWSIIDEYVSTKPERLKDSVRYITDNSAISGSLYDDDQAIIASMKNILHVKNLMYFQLNTVTEAITIITVSHKQYLQLNAFKTF